MVAPLATAEQLLFRAACGHSKPCGSSQAGTSSLLQQAQQQNHPHPGKGAQSSSKPYCPRCRSDSLS